MEVESNARHDAKEPLQLKRLSTSCLELKPTVFR